MLFAGLDVSTQSCKIVVIDYVAQDVIYVDTVNYDKDLAQYNTENGAVKNRGHGISESDPKMWIDALHIIFGKLQKSAVDQNKIKCISVSGQQHGLVALDKDGNLSRDYSKLWNDFSTQEECDILTEKASGNENMVKEVGNSQLTGYTAAKIYNMCRHEPDSFAKTATFFLVHNYINWYLSGGVIAMEPGDTSGMALWHPGQRNWSQKVINDIDSNLLNCLPPVTPSDESIGKISADLVSAYGFDPECKIDAGCGDNMYGAVGTGNIEPGIVTVSLGTSGTAYTFLEEPYIDPAGEIAAFCDSTGNYLPLLCVSNLANGYNEILRLHNISHAEFNTLIKKTMAGNDGKILIPWYIGERTPNVPNAAPLYFGFALGDFNKENLCRAVLEGHVQNLYSGFKRLPVKPREIRLTGGLAQSDAWCQAIADIFNAETVPVEGEGAALGAALHAAWVWLKEDKGGQELKEVVAPYIKLNESMRKKPDPANREIYDKQSRLFDQISKAVRSGDKENMFNLRSKMIS
jgi:xylulokinase